jgi:thymidylate kinase
MGTAAGAVVTGSSVIPGVLEGVGRHDSAPDVLPVLRRLSEGLAAGAVSYCQWKGDRNHTRWASGRGDLDLLVDPADAAPFRGLLGELDFKAVLPLPERQISGLESFIGFDREQARLVHVHVHYRLILGSYWTTRYRVPVERPVLESAVQGVVFRTPDKEFELLLLVLRTVLRYRMRHAMLAARPGWLEEIQPELDRLERQTDRVELRRRLARYLPSIDAGFLDRCVRSLRPAMSGWERMAVQRELQRRLLAHADRPPLRALLHMVVRETMPSQLASCLLRPAGMRSTSGGTVVALVGPDGAGKSTCARELHRWLSQAFATTTAHLGKPPRSLTTLVVGAALRLAGPVISRTDGLSTLELLRDVCTARDRYRLYVRVRRFAVAGGIAVCERYPLPQNRILVGPRIGRKLEGRTGSRLASWLCDAEARYYRLMLPPDVVIVLRLAPELAVRRKTDEPAEYVRARARVMWEADWTGTRAHLVDAGRRLPDVLAELMTIVWSEI